MELKKEKLTVQQKLEQVEFDLKETRLQNEKLTCDLRGAL